MKNLIMLALLLPATASAQEWGRRLIPGDSIRATTDVGQVHGRFVMWDSDLLRLSDTTLHRGSVFDIEVWEKRDAGKTFALSALYGLTSGLLAYYTGVQDPRKPGFAIGTGLVVMFGGYGLSMALTPGKWKDPEKVRR